MRCFPRLLLPLLGLSCVAWVVSVRGLSAAQIYWSDLNGLHRGAPDGTQAETLDDKEYAGSVRLDLDAGQAYWSSEKSNAIVRAGLDGADPQPIVTAASWPAGLAIDPAADLMYWTEPEGARLMRSTLAGGSPAALVNHHPLDGWVMGVAADVGQGALFWSEVGPFGSGRLLRSDLDGKNATVIYSSTFGGPTALALDSVAGWLYWASQTDDVGRGANIQRARLDGSQLETLVDFGEHAGVGALDLAIDPANGQLYWTQIQGNVAGSIWRADADGSNAVKLFDVGVFPTGLAIDNSIPGDANGDRLVNLDDFGILKAYFGAGTRRSQGDFNADHQVDLSDFGILKQNFAGQGAAVPEPAAWLLLVFGGLTAALVRIRQPRKNTH